MKGRELRAGSAISRPVPFDPEAFVADLLAAGCRVSVHEPTDHDAGPAYVWVAPADRAGTPTAGEREVRARWAAAMSACPDADERVLAVCRRRSAGSDARRPRVSRDGE